MTDDDKLPQQQATWWKAGIVYQIYPRSFMDANGDGIGDLPGITARLDYLQWLGVDAIWISPIYRSPMADFGYDVSDYTDVDPIFGTLADFEQLVGQAHARGLKVILDFVPNHTSDQHPWFLESRSSRDNPRRNWYMWADPQPGGSRPNNWLSVFGGPAWEYDDTTRQYYLHSFLKAQPDLNWRNPEVEGAISDALCFWLDRSVDGFRFDTIHFLIKDVELRDNPPRSADRERIRNMGEYDSQDHIYDKERPEVHDCIRHIRGVMDRYAGERVGIGETAIYDFPELASYYGLNGDELHMPFNFNLLRRPWQAPVFRRLVEAYEAALPSFGWPNYVLGNHDEHRLASRYGLAQARVAAMLLLTLRGTPTLYYGDELGMTDVPIPPEKEQDPWGKNVQGIGLGRDPERTPMQWDAGPLAGFSAGIAEPWLPLAADYTKVNVAVERDESRSMLSLYRRLIQTRRTSPALHSGSYRSLDAPPDCYVYIREHGAEQMCVALNFGGMDVELTLPDLGAGQVVVSTYLDRRGAVDSARLSLRAHEGVLVQVR
jgi:alpha-glucosidase